MEIIKIFFDKILKLPEEEWLAFKEIIVKKKLPANHYMLHEGEVCDFIAFIEYGLFRFFHNKAGTEFITAFFFDNEFLSNYRSFLTGQPSKHAIVSLKDASIYIIKKEKLNQLYDNYPLIDRLGRLMAERLYLGVANRLDSFIYATPEERYLELLNRNSKLLSELPQYMVASYLGISAESLSRIRKRISQT